MVVGCSGTFGAICYTAVASVAVSKGAQQALNRRESTHYVPAPCSLPIAFRGLVFPSVLTQILQGEGSCPSATFTEEEVMVLKGKATQQSQSLPSKLIPNPILGPAAIWTAEKLHLNFPSSVTILPVFLGILAIFTLKIYWNLPIGGACRDMLRAVVA